MKRMFFFVCMLFFLSAQSQRVNITGYPSLSANCVVGNSNYNVTEAIYTNTEIGPSNFISNGTAIEKISFLIAQVPTDPADAVVDSVKIFMKDVSPSQTTFPFSGSYSRDGYTQVFSGTINPTNIGLYEIQLTNPYIRAFGTNLQLLVERGNNRAHPGFVFYTANGNNGSQVAFSSRTYNGTSAPVINSTSLFQTFKRPAIQLFHAFAIDAEIKEIISPIAACHNTPQDYKVVIYNGGTTPIAPNSVQATLKIGGANSFSGVMFNAGTINPSQTETITFSGVNIENPGENRDTATILLAGDGYLFNDVLISSNFTATTIPYTIGSDTSFSAEENVETSLPTAFPYVSLLKGPVQLWTIQQGTYTNDIMVLNPFSGSTGDRFYLFDTQLEISTDSFESRLYSNCMDLPPTSSTRKAYMTFNMTHDANVFDLDDSIYVSISATRGLSWTLLGAFGRVDLSLPDNEPVWRTEEIEIPAAFDGQVVQFGFKGVSKFGNAIGLDDINIFTRPSPINKLHFTANRNGAKSVMLNWSVVGYENCVNFIVERSADGKNYAPIGELRPNLFLTGDYTFSDQATLRGNNYYRLRLVTPGRNPVYSPVRMIRFADNSEMLITPNPVSSVLSLYFESETNEKIQISVTDMRGGVVLAQQAGVSAGGSKVDIPVDRLPKGNYIVTTILNGVRISQKMIKL